MSEEDKQPYCDEYEAEKVVYNEQLKAYRNSPAYKRWLEAKIQGECTRDRRDRVKCGYVSTNGSLISTFSDPSPVKAYLIGYK